MRRFTFPFRKGKRLTHAAGGRGAPRTALNESSVASLLRWVTGSLVVASQVDESLSNG